MRIDIMTLFPDMCNAVLSESIIGRARQAGKVEINCVDIRNYTLDKHRRVDDKPYGGGMGMIMFAEIYGEWNERRGSYKWQSLTKCATYYGYALH